MNALSVARINEESPYRVEQASNGDFVFQTKEDVIYGIGFTEEFPLGGCVTYQFTITNLNQRHGAHDSNIEKTVIVIINEFFRQNLDVLLYICDTSDHRESQRNRLFLTWFERHAEQGRFSIRTANATIEGEGFYAAIIVENRNPKLKAITEDFEWSARELAEKP